MVLGPRLGLREPVEQSPRLLREEHLVAQAPGRRELLGAAGDPALGHVRLSVSAQDRVRGVPVAYRRGAFLQ